MDRAAQMLLPEGRSRRWPIPVLDLSREATASVGAAPSTCVIYWVSVPPQLCKIVKFEITNLKDTKRVNVR